MYQNVSVERGLQIVCTSPSPCFLNKTKRNLRGHYDSQPFKHASMRPCYVRTLKNEPDGWGGGWYVFSAPACVRATRVRKFRLPCNYFHCYLLRSPALLRAFLRLFSCGGDLNLLKHTKLPQLKYLGSSHFLLLDVFYRITEDGLPGQGQNGWPVSILTVLRLWGLHHSPWLSTSTGSTWVGGNHQDNWFKISSTSSAMNYTLGWVMVVKWQFHLTVNCS